MRSGAGATCSGRRARGARQPGAAAGLSSVLSITSRGCCSTPSCVNTPATGRWGTCGSTCGLKLGQVGHEHERRLLPQSLNERRGPLRVAETHDRHRLLLRPQGPRGCSVSFSRTGSYAKARGAPSPVLAACRPPCGTTESPNPGAEGRPATRPRDHCRGFNGDLPRVALPPGSGGTRRSPPGMGSSSRRADTTRPADASGRVSRQQHQSQR